MHESLLTACRLGSVGRKPKETQPPEGDRPQRPVINASVGWEFYQWLAKLPPTEGEGPNMARHVRKAIALYRHMQEEGTLEHAEQALAELRALREAHGPGEEDPAVQGLSDLSGENRDAILDLASEARRSEQRAALLRSLADVLAPDRHVSRAGKDTHRAKTRKGAASATAGRGKG